MHSSQTEHHRTNLQNPSALEHEREDLSDTAVHKNLSESKHREIKNLNEETHKSTDGVIGKQVTHRSHGNHKSIERNRSKGRYARNKQHGHGKQNGSHGHQRWGSIIPHKKHGSHGIHSGHGIQAGRRKTLRKSSRY